MAEPEVLDLTFDSASDDEERAPPVRAPGYKNHNAPGLREAPEAPRRRSVPTKRYSEEFAPPRREEHDDDEGEIAAACEEECADKVRIRHRIRS